MTAADWIAVFVCWIYSAVMFSFIAIKLITDWVSEGWTPENW